ncbi:MAG TPA: 30S ribosomal protein S6 [Candidatus Paceibacterota bacterium]
MDDIQSTKVYELGYHLLSTLGEAEVAKFHSDVTALVTSKGGEIISEMAPELIRLAYPMFKVIDNKRISFETAHFGVIKFEGTIELLEEVAQMVKIHKGVLRHLLINTVREDTLAKKRPMRGIQRASKSDESETEAEAPVAAAEEPEVKDDVQDDEMQNKINKLVEEDLTVEGDE